MKKMIPFLLALCLLLAACGGTAEQPAAQTQPQQTEEIPVTEVLQEAPATTAPVQDAVKIYPLPENGMEDLNDGIFSISLEAGDAYVDDTGKMQMDVKIYSYDRYDIADISMLKVGDILVTNTGEVALTSLERPGDGSLSLNGGLEAGGLVLTHDELGVFYERCQDGEKNWHQIGEATIRVSEDFVYHDHGSVEQEETVYYPGSFLNGEVADYNITPYNATIRVENGQIIEMHRYMQ